MAMSALYPTVGPTAKPCAQVQRWALAATPPAWPCPLEGHCRLRSMVPAPAHCRPPPLSKQTEWLPAKLRPCLPLRHLYLPCIRSCHTHAPAHRETLGSGRRLSRPAPPPARQSHAKSETERNRKIQEAGVHAFDAPQAGAATGGAACSHGVQPAGRCSSRPGQLKAGSECQNRQLDKRPRFSRAARQRSRRGCKAENMHTAEPRGLEPHRPVYRLGPHRARPKRKPLMRRAGAPPARPAPSSGDPHRSRQPCAQYSDLARLIK